MKRVDIKKGNECIDLRDGHRGVIVDIQHHHDRYQFDNLSGWQHGIGNLVIVPVGFNHNVPTE